MNIKIVNSSEALEGKTGILGASAIMMMSFMMMMLMDYGRSSILEQTQSS